MTWNQQIRGLKRRLSSAQLQQLWKRKRQARDRRQQHLPCPPVVISGKVSDDFIERMRLMGVTVKRVQ